MSRLGRVVSPQPQPEGADEALRSLGDTQRQTAELRFLHGYTIREIARKLGAPEGTIKSRLFHARREIEQAIDQENNT